MARELLLDDSPLRREFITPGEDGAVTIRTQYWGTDEVLGANDVLRSEAPASFTEKGRTFYHAARVPMEIYEQMTIKLGRHPTARELIELSQSRDYGKLRTTDAKL